MTNDQIKARCELAVAAIALICEREDYEQVSKDQEKANTLESLCREMISEGLEMAAQKADRYPCNPEARRGMASLADWCREEAQRVKEAL
jgi:hypothetical protein